jgi:hypothetical protein
MQGPSGQHQPDINDDGLRPSSGWSMRPWESVPATPTTLSEPSATLPAASRRRRGLRPVPREGAACVGAVHICVGVAHGCVTNAPPMLHCRDIVGHHERSVAEPAAKLAAVSRASTKR